MNSTSSYRNKLSGASMCQHFISIIIALAILGGVLTGYRLIARSTVPAITTPHSNIELLNHNGVGTLKLVIGDKTYRVIQKRDVEEIRLFGETYLLVPERL